MSRTLSKTRFLSGLQCHKKLWWEWHEPDAPELIPDSGTLAIFRNGHLAGAAAREAVPGGVLMDGDPLKKSERVEETRAAIQGGAKTVYEAAFTHGGVFCAVDILQKGRAGWRLVEVKSSTKVKDEHLPDAAVQSWILRSTGLPLEKVELMHLNSDYRRPAPTGLFKRAALQDQLGDWPDSRIAREVRRQEAALAAPLPDVAPGPHCTVPRTCPFWDRCHAPQPGHSVDTLYRLPGARREQLAQRGYRTIYDLPDEEPLPEIASRQRWAVKNNRRYVGRGLARQLADLKGRIAFLDFESVGPAIPAWDGCGPYMQIPVQFSVHMRHPDGSLTHTEWLAQPGGDPRPELAEALIEACEDAERVVVYNASFERGCIEHIAENFPGLRKGLKKVADRLWDLLPVVRNHIYDPGFNGRFGLKYVLPALVPDMGYDNLAIQGGQAASAQLEAYLLDSDAWDAARAAAFRRDVMAYCHLDTLAMVRMVEVMGN